MIQTMQAAMLTLPTPVRSSLSAALRLTKKRFLLYGAIVGFDVQLPSLVEH